MPKEVNINIPAPDIQVANVEIVGVRPIIFSQFPEKAKAEMLAKQQKTAKSNKVKAPRDPESEYYASFYLDAKGNISIPAINLKQAIVDSARNVNGLAMTLLRGSVFVIGDELGLINVLHKGKSISPSEIKKLDRVENCIYAVDSKIPEVIQMREDYVRLSGIGSPADLRFRGQVKDWTLKFGLKWNNDVLQLEQILNLVQIAGFACGLGEWRPQKNGDFGMFELRQ